MALPAYKAPVRKKPHTGPPIVTLMLLVMAPAVFAVAVLRPRSSR